MLIYDVKDSTKLEKNNKNNNDRPRFVAKKPYKNTLMEI